MIYRFAWMGVWLLAACTSQNTASPEAAGHNGEIAIALHGGAGNLKKLNLTPQEEAAYKHMLDSAATVGYKMLSEGSTSEEVVEAVIRIMETSPLFNAGIGAVLNHEGQAEMDAAIMKGGDLSCGTVAGLMHIEHPISAARMVMNKSEHVFLVGAGAELFLMENGMDTVSNSLFITPKRLEQWKEAVEEDKVSLDHEKPRAALELHDALEGKFGTVGCVALDKSGNLCAGTSTGGLVNKRYGRVGDSPIIGAGTYANNASCAVSCTGKGEDFIRLTVARDIADLCAYKGEVLDSAVHHVLFDKLKPIKGRGGVIALNRQGQIAMQFTTTGMYRASIDPKGAKVVEIY